MKFYNPTPEQRAAEVRLEQQGYSFLVWAAGSIMMFIKRGSKLRESYQVMPDGQIL